MNGGFTRRYQPRLIALKRNGTQHNRLLRRRQWCWITRPYLVIPPY
jgi:hypothetical protein